MANNTHIRTIKQTIFNEELNPHESSIHTSLVLAAWSGPSRLGLYYNFIKL